MGPIERRIAREAKAMTKEQVFVKALEKRISWLQAADILGVTHFIGTFQSGYTLITQSAANQLTTYAQQTEPFKRMQNERISVDVVALVQLSKDTWQADWRETSWDKGGSELGQAVWRGTFRVLRVPDTEEQLVTNPIGLFVDEFHWSRVQG
jgi:type IV secretory pathway TrbF-like protein